MDNVTFESRTARDAATIQRNPAGLEIGFDAFVHVRRLAKARS